MKSTGPVKSIVATILLISCGFAFAHSGATGVVKMRMDMMSNIASQMKIVGTMLNGSTDFDVAAISAAAQKIKTHATGLEKNFPKGSIKGPSEALPAIWNDWSGFTELMTDMERAAAKLEQTAQQATRSADIIAPFKDLSATCSACHRDYRKKK